MHKIVIGSQRFDFLQLDEAQDAQQHVRVAAFVDEPVATTGRRVSTAAPNEVNELRVLYKVFEQ